MVEYFVNKLVSTSKMEMVAVLMNDRVENAQKRFIDPLMMRNARYIINPRRMRRRVGLSVRPSVCLSVRTLI